jgi:hypothetical protein
MRLSMRALFGVMLVGWNCCHVVAAESGSKWWPFGAAREAEAPQIPAAQLPGVSPSATTPLPGTTELEPAPTLPEYSTAGEPERRWMINSPLAKVSWPRIHMPELPPSPWPKRSEIDAARNSWARKSPDPTKPSPLQAMSDGARRVGQSTRAAWNKTVDALTPGDRSDDSSRVARREGPSAWNRLFGQGDPQEGAGAETITEWMAQDRIDP